MYSRGKLPCPPRSRALLMLSKADPTNFNSTVSRGTCGGMWVEKKNLVTLLQLLHYSLHILIKTSSIQWSHFPQAKNSPFPCHFFHLRGYGTASFLKWQPLLLEGQIPMPHWVLFPFPPILSFFLEKYQVKPSNIVLHHPILAESPMRHKSCPPLHTTSCLPTPSSKPMAVGAEDQTPQTSLGTVHTKDAEGWFWKCWHWQCSGSWMQSSSR